MNDPYHAGTLTRVQFKVYAFLAVISLAACSPPSEEQETTPFLEDSFSNDLTNWVIEQQPGGEVSIKNGKLIVAGPGGCSVWFKEKLTAPVAITYTIKASSEGRVSDINCFWMASNPAHPDHFAPGHGRTGEFNTYDKLKTYYTGFGGNKNSTTRFRRYTGDGERPLLPEHNLREQEHMIVPDKTYSIRLVAADGRAQYYRDGELIFDFADPEPLENGYFAFRTVNSHLVIDDFVVWKIADPETVLKGAEPSFN